MEDSGAKGLQKKQANSFKRGDHIMIGDKPCKVNSTTNAKPGEHESDEIIIVAQGILDDEKIEKTFGSSDSIDVPIMKRTEYKLLGIRGNYLLLEVDSYETKEDVKLSDYETMKEVNANIKKYLDTYCKDVYEDGSEYAVDYDNENVINCLVTVLNLNGLEIPCSVREHQIEN